MFRVVTELAVISEIEQSYQIHCCIAVRLSWPQHLQASRLLELAPQEQRGAAFALMGMALLMLAQDLADGEAASAAPAFPAEADS